ncbi:hypothetical protein PR048_031070 [Dryococelus australis]|uniref:Uncharacterized protein n=1 Tax=Dryococelus australis TaxID=614101 RepID=A0ABQ9G8D4_9NEOP|nr:hypothetical protein PR048_031070 [Dryococelus australis]
MADEETLLLSGSEEKLLNKERRRKIQLSEWKDNKNKALRNAGKPYRNRKGTFVPGKCASEKECDKISKDMKTKLFQDFYRQTYNEQSMYLVQRCMALEDVKRRNVAEDVSRRQPTFKYQLPVNGKSYNVCKKTVLNVFKISSRRVQTLQTKMKVNLDI